MLSSDIVFYGICAFAVYNGLLTEVWNDIVVSLCMLVAYRVGAMAPWIYLFVAIPMRMSDPPITYSLIPDQAHLISIFFVAVASFAVGVKAMLADDKEARRASHASQYVPNAPVPASNPVQVFTLDNKAGSYLNSALAQLNKKEMRKLANQLLAILYKTDDHVKNAEEESDSSSSEEEEEEEEGKGEEEKTEKSKDV